jgi:hypothetical protein
MDPMGMALARASDEHEEIIYAEIDAVKARNKRITHYAGEWDLDRFGDRRPELYGLILEQPEGSQSEP